MKPKNHQSRKSTTLATRATRLFAGGTAVMAGLSLLSGAAFAEDAVRLDKVEKENADLKQRLESLEAVAKKEGIMPSGDKAPKLVNAMSDITISGFAQASYFYNARKPADGQSDGYLWNTTHNSFSLNKFKLTLASKPAERSGEKWDAGFRTSLMWGEDAQVLNTGSGRAGMESLREAYVDLNLPVGTGLNVKFGQLISLLNYESGDGGAANNNFSQGYQWWFTGNGPASGIQLDYDINEWLNLKVRVQNGLRKGPTSDINGSKTVVGSINLKPDSKTWVNLIGWGGDETRTETLRGGSVLAGRQWTEEFNSGFEYDYFNWDSTTLPSQEVWSLGTFLNYDFSPTFGVGGRVDYVNDPDGAINTGFDNGPLAGPNRANSAIVSTDPHGSLASFTLTLNFKPTKSIRIQPEIRYDKTTYAGGFDGAKDRFIFGAGASYLF